MVQVKVHEAYEPLFDKVLKMLERKGFFIKENSKEGWYITANKKTSWFSYGETIEITFSSQDKDTIVSVNSYSIGPQILDWGTNADNEKLIGNNIKELLK